MRKLRLHIAFFKSTLPLSIPITMALGSILYAGDPGSGFLLYIRDLLFVFCTLAFVPDILYKEVAKKEEYYFYYNQGLTKIRLIVGNYLIAVLLYFTFTLCALP